MYRTRTINAAELLAGDTISVFAYGEWAAYIVVSVGNVIALKNVKNDKPAIVFPTAIVELHYVA